MQQIASNMVRHSAQATNKLLLTVLVAICLPLFGCGNTLEASFKLAHESRLPKWFALPPGLSRADVTVTMNYYVKSPATFILLDSRGKKLAEAEGVLKGLEPLKLRNPPPGFPPGYPMYEIVTANGVSEVIEHRRMEPIFYITDDPAVLAELNLSQNKE